MTARRYFGRTRAAERHRARKACRDGYEYWRREMDDDDWLDFDEAGFWVDYRDHEHLYWLAWEGRWDDEYGDDSYRGDPPAVVQARSDRRLELRALQRLVHRASMRVCVPLSLFFSSD